MSRGENLKSLPPSFLYPFKNFLSNLDQKKKKKKKETKNPKTEDESARDTQSVSNFQTAWPPGSTVSLLSLINLCCHDYFLLILLASVY